MESWYDAAAGWPVEYPAGTLDAVADLDGGSLLAWDPSRLSPLGGALCAALKRWRTEYDAGLVFQGNKFGDSGRYDAGDR
ncbi:MAG: hypothetical protein CM15mP103_09950 [Gammaproteobacteria bacterium]|nr:MAG: hypothetical protein CM15mP103_09950 [Gammaproteobacteria bacterium]